MTISYGNLGVYCKVGPGGVVESNVATVTTALSVGEAIDELLFGKSHKRTIINLVSTVYGGNDDKCPAGATISLIFDSRYNIL